MPPKPHRVIVRDIQRQPRHRPIAAPRPIGQQRRLAEPSRRAHHGQLAGQRLGQLIDQPRAGHQAVMFARDMQLGRQQRIQPRRPTLGRGRRRRLTHGHHPPRRDSASTPIVERPHPGWWTGRGRSQGNSTCYSDKSAVFPPWFANQSSAGIPPRKIPTYRTPFERCCPPGSIPNARVIEHGRPGRRRRALTAASHAGSRGDLDDSQPGHPPPGRRHVANHPPRRGGSTGHPRRAGSHVGTVLACRCTGSEITG